MGKFRLNIDGKEVFGYPDQTILDVARENDIFIPTLCFDDRTEIYGACGLCMVEAEGMPKLMKACATKIAPNMIIHTDTERVKESRKTNLELLLSNHVGDCRPPCMRACPAGTDCQGYVGLIANEQYEDAIKLIRENIPLPGSIGRVCPHPCEQACRRGLIEEPVAIANLKRFAADTDEFGPDPFVPEIPAKTGKSVGIIGGGPYGISMAYFLRQRGHAVTIYDAMPKLGGMLRYGIPEYRLPKAVLDEEVNTLVKMGVEIITDTKIGVDVSFDKIRAKHDAVCIGIGAWVSTGVRCKGEDSQGVIGGIDFLRKIVKNESIQLGDNVAIVGGGNTAMDACRSAVRLGAKQVYNIYRRTKDEMPADALEIEEAEEEGVIFLNLTNPLEIIADENGHCKQMVLQVMELGEPDASGRRAPIPVEGKTKTIDVDTVILAIGQKVDAASFSGFDLTRKGGIVYDKNTFMTAIPGVFAGGDCGNDKISIAVEAIGDAKKGSAVVDAYLQGVEVAYKPKYYVTRDDEMTPASFEDRERIFRDKLPQLSADERKDNFTEVIGSTYSLEDAVKEAKRCLECGCKDYFECKLVNYANQYDVKPERFGGDINRIDYEDEHPFVLRDPNKCILCGLCVRACDEVMGVGALGLVKRGFDTVVKPTLEKPLALSGCISCGQCTSVCPTGALQERQSITKSVPLDTKVTKTTCSYCSVGCSVDVETYGERLVVKANPDVDGAVNKGLLCGRGKFGTDMPIYGDYLTAPMAKKNGVLTEVDYHEALILAAKKTESLATVYGKDAVAVSISDRLTNEEAYAAKKFAEAIGARTVCLNHRQDALAKVLGLNASPNTIDELISADVILVFGFMAHENEVIRLKLKQAAENGSKIYLINPAGYEQKYMRFAEAVVTDNTLNFAKGLAKAVSTSASALNGYEAFAASVADAEVCQQIQAVADAYLGAKRAMIVYQQNVISEDAAMLLADIALASGHIGRARDGILKVLPKNNSQGLRFMGITDGAESLDGVKALISFGEDPDAELLKDMEYVAVVDTHLTEAAKAADLVIPGTAFLQADGTYFNTERRLQKVNPLVMQKVPYTNIELILALADIYEINLGFKCEKGLKAALSADLDVYRNTAIGQIAGGVLKPSDACLQPISGNVFVDPLSSTDALLKGMDERLPKVVDATC